MTDIKDSDKNQTKTRHPKNDDKRRQGSFNKIRTAHIQVRQLAAQNISYRRLATKQGRRSLMQQVKS